MILETLNMNYKKARKANMKKMVRDCYKSITKASKQGYTGLNFYIKKNSNLSVFDLNIIVRFFKIKGINVIPKKESNNNIIYFNWTINKKG